MRRQIWAPVSLLLLLLGLAGCAGQTARRPLSAYLAPDPAERRAILALVAGRPGAGAPYTFDGASRGRLVVTIPAGWTLLVDLHNEAPFPVSAAIVAKPGDARPVEPSATTYQPRHGTPTGGGSGFSWLARPGRFWIASLVPGQAERGLYATLWVVKGGRPSISLVR